MSIAASQQLPAIASAPSAIFPLPMTVFESFMVSDDRPDYPMMCDMEMQLQGRVDRSAFESGLAFALARNPLFTCRVERRRRGSLVWVQTGQTPVVQWVSLDSPLDDSYGAFTDLTAELGFRIWVRQGEAQAKVLLHFHHACSDAMGAFAFIEDLLAGYTAAIPGSPVVTPRPVDYGRLLRRGEAGMVGRSLSQRIYDAVVGPREGLKFALKSPPPLAAVARQSDAPVEPPVRPGFLTVACPNHVASGLRRLASEAGVTANDVLMRDLFLVLARWNLAHDPHVGRHWLRILMPQNLRGRDDAAMPAANVMSFTFIARHSDLCAAPDKLLHLIHEETDAIRRGLLSIYFTKALRTLQSTRTLPWLLNRGACFATAVLTNLSDPTRRFVAKFPRSSQGLVVGDLVLEGIAGAPPLRPHTHAAFVVINSAQSFSICCRWDPRRLTALDAQSLLDTYMAQLHETAARHPSRP